MIPASLTLVALIVIAPTLIFSLGLLAPLPGICAAALAAGSAFVLVRRTDWRAPADYALLAASLAVAGALTLTSGVGHFFWQPDDWMVRDAMLFDLVRHPWPVVYALDVGSGLLRAPLGMYLLPAVVGKIAGTHASEAALFVQNTALLGLCLYIFARTLPPGAARYAAIGLFVAFSGLDCLAWLIRDADVLPKLILPHLEPWNGFFQYSSNVTQIFWTPHHGLAGWAVVAAYLVWQEGKIAAVAIAPIWAAALFWSPLAAFGALPFLAFAFLCDIRDRKLRWADGLLAVAAGLAALPVLVFLSRDTLGVERGFVDVNEEGLLSAYWAMIGLEVVPFLAIAWHSLPKGLPTESRRRLELLIVAAALFAIPFYKMGFANDFAMRASIPALTLLCVRCFPLIVSFGSEPVMRRVIVLVFLLLGAVTPAVEIARGATLPALPASDCNVLESLKDGPYAGSPVSYYIATRSSFETASWLFKAPTASSLSREITRCWPGRRFVYGPASPL